MPTTIIETTKDIIIQPSQPFVHPFSQPFHSSSQTYKIWQPSTQQLLFVRYFPLLSLRFLFVLKLSTALDICFCFFFLILLNCRTFRCSCFIPCQSVSVFVVTWSFLVNFDLWSSLSYWSWFCKLSRELAAVWGGFDGWMDKGLNEYMRMSRFIVILASTILRNENMFKLCSRLQLLIMLK